MVKIQIVYSSKDGQQHIHKAGCADIKRNREYSDEGYIIEGESYEAAIKSEADAQNEGNDREYSVEELYKVFPCAK